MKKIMLWCIVVGAVSMQATYTVKSDFLRVAQIVKNATFPLNLKGYLDISFKMDIEKATQKGVKATVDRLIDGKVVDTYKGFFVFGKRQGVEFSNGAIGPKLEILAEDKERLFEEGDEPEQEMSF